MTKADRESPGKIWDKDKTRMALSSVSAYLCQSPKVLFNSIEPDAKSNKTHLNLLDPDFFWIRLTLYSHIDTSYLNMPDFFKQDPRIILGAKLIIHLSFIEVHLVFFVGSCWQTNKQTNKKKLVMVTEHFRCISFLRYIK